MFNQEVKCIERDRCQERNDPDGTKPGSRFGTQPRPYPDRLFRHKPGNRINDGEAKTKDPVPLGYSASGVVTAVGEGVPNLTPGQKVACYGGPYVRHAEQLLVPKNLVVPVPERGSLEEAAFVGLGAIAIHALRKASVSFGETVVVIGLGIVGQLVSQIASVAGCRVLAFDLIPERCNLLRQCCDSAQVADKIETLETMVWQETEGIGADSVLLCAKAPDGHLINRALRFLRERGSVIVVGDLKMEFDRELMFAKEASITVSKAGEPGRTDRIYVKEGVDYPPGLVRWTEGRNMKEFIRLLDEGRIRLTPLVSGAVTPERAGHAYEMYMAAPEKVMGMLIRFDNNRAESLSY